MQVQDAQTRGEVFPFGIGSDHYASMAERADFVSGEAYAAVMRELYRILGSARVNGEDDESKKTEEDSRRRFDRGVGLVGDPLHHAR